MNDALRIPGDRRLHVTNCFAPAGGAEHPAAKNIFGDETHQAVQPHHLGVPDSHHVQAAGVIGLEAETFQRLGTNVGAVFHPTSRTLRQRSLSKRPRENEVTFRIARIHRDSTPPILFRSDEQGVTLRGVRGRRAEVDRRARRFPERLVVFRTFGNGLLVVIERCRNVERGVSAVALPNLFLCGLRGGSTRETKNHYCGAYAQTHSLSRRLSVSAGFTPTNPE